MSGSALRRVPFLKSAICCTMYATERPTTLEFSGRPNPFGR